MAEMTDLAKACKAARRYHLDVFGTKALLADLPPAAVDHLLQPDEDNWCTCTCEGCRHSGHCFVNYTGCGAGDTWADGHTKRGCYWRLLDNKVFGYDCHAADDTSDCTCEPELKQIRGTETDVLTTTTAIDIAFKRGYDARVEEEKQERDAAIRDAVADTKPDPRMTTPQEDT